jgi:hypothetical protein
MIDPGQNGQDRTARIGLPVQGIARIRQQDQNIEDSQKKTARTGQL